MTTLIRILGYLIIGAGTVLLLENLRTLSIYIAIVLWFVIIVILLCIEDEFSKTHTDLQIYGCIYYGMFFYYLFFGTIHVKHIDGHVTLYSPLLWHKIDYGERVDTLSLRSHVDCEYYSHSEHFETFYFLTVGGDSLHIYNRFDLKMKIPKRHSIIQQPYYGGVLVDLIQVEGDVYSLDGELIDENWRPRIHDITPIDYTN